MNTRLRVLPKVRRRRGTDDFGNGRNVGQAKNRVGGRQVGADEPGSILTMAPSVGAAEMSAPCLGGGQPREPTVTITPNAAFNFRLVVHVRNRCAVRLKTTE